MSRYRCRNCRLEVNSNFASPSASAEPRCTSASGHIWDQPANDQYSQRYRCRNCNQVTHTHNAAATPDRDTGPRCTSSSGHQWSRE